MATYIDDLLLKIISVVQDEKAFIKNRQTEGIAAAKEKGVRFGRPVKEAPENFAILVKQWENGELPIAEVLRQTELKEATFYRRLKEYRLEREDEKG